MAQQPPYGPTGSDAPRPARPSRPLASLLPPYPLPKASDEPAVSCAPPLDPEAAYRGRPLRVLIAAAEAVPFVKTGGPADITGPLAHALRRLGHDVRLALPLHKSVDPARWGLQRVLGGLPVPFSSDSELVDVLETQHPDGLRVSFIDAPHAFQREQLYGYADEGERFILFCRAVLEYVRAIGWAPDVIHCHDWHTAIIPNWITSLYRADPVLSGTATVYTIHNLAHHGVFGYRILEVAGVAQQGFLYPELPELANLVDLMGRGILCADVVSTVSPRYAREILSPEFGMGLDHLLRERKDRLYGILNGIDADELDPATDQRITARYDAFNLEPRLQNKRALQKRMKLPVEDRVPLIGMISRLQDEKGFGLLDQVVLPVLEQGVQLVVAGTGDHHYHQMMQRLQSHYPRQVALQLTFGDEMSRAIYAGADMLLMPSHFEPCGLNQMIAMRYGCIPIVHATGGLADTVQEYDPEHDVGTGFSFSHYEPFHLFAAIVRALEVHKIGDAWRDLMQRAMLTDHSWDASAEQYVALYRRAQDLQQAGTTRAPERRVNV